MIDTYDLNRFVTAQSGVIDEALGELRRGRKETHWMWFVFPQLVGNDPHRTANDFMESLDGDFAGAFSHVMFAITDWSSERKFLGPFRDELLSRTRHSLTGE